jgi:predicted nuclease of predicted toxin-antitoxin system
MAVSGAKERDMNLALLIDADNISSRFGVAVLEKAASLGTLVESRVYCLNPCSLAKWKKLMPAEAGFVHVSPSVRKNATDFVLTIGAMDIFYTREVDGFCVVSSDSDFGALADDLRAKGKTVFGIGGELSSPKYRAAFNYFENMRLRKPGRAEEVPTKGESS